MNAKEKNKLKADENIDTRLLSRFLNTGPGLIII